MTIPEPILFFWDVYEELRKHKQYKRADYLREMLKAVGVTITVNKDKTTSIFIKK